MNEELIKEEEMVVPEAEDLTADEAKSSLGLATRLLEGMMPQQEMEETEEPTEEGEGEAEEPEEDMEEVKEEIKNELREEFKKTIKEEVQGLREDIKAALND